MTDMMAAIRNSSDHWQDSYHRLSEAHRRLQRVNQGLEDKLLRLADRTHSEKSTLTEQADKLSTALTTAASAIHRLKGEKERLQHDLNIAIQLLQCNSSQYGKHKIDSLPLDMQQRVQVRLESEAAQQRGHNPSNNPTKAPDVKVIRVPIPTFPPTAMVYSLNKCDEDTPDEEEVQEAEDMVSAAIMAAVLEERQKEQRHCPTCTCSPDEGSPHTASSSSGGRSSGGAEGRSGGPAGSDTNGMSPFFSSDGRKFAKGCAVLDDESSASSSYRALEGNDVLYADLAKSVASNAGHESKRESDSFQSESNLLVNNDKKSSNELRTPASASLIDLHDMIGDSGAVAEAKKRVPKEKVNLVDLSMLRITEHFNSDTMSNITVNKCICGRPYSEGTNVIDVGTQTVPSYIGESGKVRSTCIYCKGHKIRDKATKDSKVARPKRDVGKIVMDKGKERDPCSSPHLTRSCSDGESVSLMSNSSTTDSSCSGDLNTNSNVSDIFSSCSISSSIANMNLANSSTPVNCALDRKLDCALNSPCSAHAWNWTQRAKKLSHVDSGSPSTPNSFVSSSCESGLSSSSSPHHEVEDASIKTNGSSCKSQDVVALKKFESSRYKTSKSFREVHKQTAHRRLQSAEDGSSQSEFAGSLRSSVCENPEMCADARKTHYLCKLDVSTQCPLVQTVSTQAQTTTVMPTVASDSSVRSFGTSASPTQLKKPVETILDSSLNELDDLSSLEVSTDLLARLTGHFEYFKDNLQDLQEGISEDSGIFSNSPLLNDKSIPYILDNLSERERVQHSDLQRSLLASPYGSNPSTTLQPDPNLSNATHDKLAMDLSSKLNNDLISSLNNDSVYLNSNLADSLGLEMIVPPEGLNKYLLMQPTKTTHTMWLGSETMFEIKAFAMEMFFAVVMEVLVHFQGLEPSKPGAGQPKCKLLTTYLQRKRYMRRSPVKCLKLLCACIKSIIS
ncbi:hypothetical protein FHG87_010794 [Trinorchestia longiramus]|nr:hypothetical protein FHG87_010794 [Trinorchestia longiramus]